MSMTELMVSGMVKKICGSFKIKYNLNPGEEPVEVDFTPPFRRVSMIDGLEEVLKCKLPALDDPEVRAGAASSEMRRGRGSGVAWSGARCSRYDLVPFQIRRPDSLDPRG